MITLIVGIVFVLIAYCGVCSGYDLWVDKSGFLWGLFASMIFDFCISAISGVTKVVWHSLTKGGSSSSIGGKVLNILYAGIAAYGGYHILLMGWSCWWTGFWASLLFGLPGLFTGGMMLISAVGQVILSLAPRESWAKYVK